MAYRKSSKSICDETCVEVEIEPGVARLRDTKDRSKPPHVFDSREWDAFVAGVKAGEFDPV